MLLPSSTAGQKPPLVRHSLSQHTQATVIDSQTLLDVIPVGPIEIKSPASSIADLVRLIATAQSRCSASLTDDQVLSLP